MITFGIGHGSIFAPLGKLGIGIIHGIAQGVVSKLRGGSFRAGFAAGLIGHMSPTLNITGDSAAAIISRTLYAGLWGGLASMASGGKFEDGAFQAAMVHLFNNEGKADWDEKQKTWIYHDNDSQEDAARTSWNTQIKNAYSRVGEGISEYWYLNPGGAAVAAGIGGNAIGGLIKGVGRFFGFGPRTAWIRRGPSYSEALNVNTAKSISYGSNRYYRSKIPNQRLRDINASLRNYKLPGNGPRTADPGHFHIKF